MAVMNKASDDSVGMTHIQTLRECLAPLIHDRNVPMQAVGAIGGIIERDARLSDDGGILTGNTTFEEVGLNLERYEELLDRAKAARQEFSIDGDQLRLIQSLFKIRDDVASFEQALAHERAGRGNDTPFGKCV